jgi:hypothetical protein
MGEGRLIDDRPRLERAHRSRDRHLQARQVFEPKHAFKAKHAVGLLSSGVATGSRLENTARQDKGNDDKGHDNFERAYAETERALVF